MILKARDLAVAAVTVAVTLAVTHFIPLHEAEKNVMGSSCYDWQTIENKPTKVGSMRRFFQAPTATLDELECHVTTLNVGESPHPPHQHPDEELIIVKEGEVEALVAGEWKRLGPGSVIFQASNIPHAIRNAGTSTACYHVIKWNSPGMLRKNSEARRKS
ncbi:MAG: cupin domain-containing protein [Gloeobacteraceae cyanobacterium ES-bin-144]|nr:cupin domain-containing protein [Verrucomicrobiales bacterium]